MTLILSDGRTKSEQPQQQQQQEPCLIIAGENLPQSPAAEEEEKEKGPAVAALLLGRASRQAGSPSPLSCLARRLPSAGTFSSRPASVRVRAHPTAPCPA